MLTDLEFEGNLQLKKKWEIREGFHFEENERLKEMNILLAMMRRVIVLLIQCRDEYPDSRLEILKNQNM
jgi:hypothetical protein